MYIQSCYVFWDSVLHVLQLAQTAYVFVICTAVSFVSKYFKIFRKKCTLLIEIEATVRVCIDVHQIEISHRNRFILCVTRKW